MPIASIVKALGTELTSQQIADFAKSEWDAAKRALANGDKEKAAEHMAEFDALAELFQRG